TRYWNPKMAPFIFGHRNKIHIVNLEKTVVMYNDALKFVSKLAANKGTILFVATKRQAREIIKEEAMRAGCPFVDHRWLGGMLTNFQTIQSRIDYMVRLEDRKAKGEFELLPKKEALQLQDKMARLVRLMGGIREMTKRPSVIFVIDPNKERLAIAEALRLEIPLVALVDTNCNPNEIDYPVPANDDAIRAVKLLSSKIADAVIEGQQMRQSFEAEDESEQAMDAAELDED
ncbi:MAG: 30S ribosomal protein S2, partial [Dehalococcoidia bacterium]|nr:30S ribosomal protein S2 [Dehalococcoidia bacterium]